MITDSIPVSTRRSYRVCTRCVMDTTDPDIDFDIDGICSHCRHYAQRVQRELPNREQRQRKLEALVSEIRQQGCNQAYDCVIGVSGGVDSTYVAYLVKSLGLRPLAVHLDNGWNSELAVKNIEQTLNRLGVDLLTHVVDWEEFRDIQLSLIKASVANIEAVTDHAIMALLFRTAARRKIRYIISGGNIATEAIMPSSWMHDNRDWRFIRSIHRRFGSRPVRTLPYCTLAHYFYLVFLRQIKYVPILNYVDYVKADAKELLVGELGWRDYGGKHYESIITRFFQAYILPRKFGIDKRRAHLSTLILSGQMSREEALAELELPPCPEKALREDLEFFWKKMELSPAQFEAVMNTRPKSSSEYPSNNWLFKQRPALIAFVKRVTRPASLK